MEESVIHQYTTDEAKIDASMYAPHKDLKPGLYVKSERFEQFKKKFAIRAAMMIFFGKPDEFNESYMDSLIEAEEKIAIAGLEPQRNLHRQEAREIGDLQAGDCIKINAVLDTSKKQLEEMEKRLEVITKAANRRTIFGKKNKESK